MFVSKSFNIYFQMKKTNLMYFQVSPSPLEKVPKTTLPILSIFKNMHIIYENIS